MNAIESAFRKHLGVPQDAQYVLIVDQAAHMDWDWQETFAGYFTSTSQGETGGNGAGVNPLLTEAASLLQQSSSTIPYYYSICEMAYLQAFVLTNPALAGVIASAGANGYLRIVGGGITSPDCLVTSGEGFLRNYLVGKLWLAARFPGTNLAQLRHCWLPDDFGQDPELPIAVKAMGMESISFSRIPGYVPLSTSAPANWNLELVNSLLTQGNGVDFYWQASDGASSVFTHWMPGGVPGYYQGSSLFEVQSDSTDQQPAAVIAAINQFLAGYTNQGAYAYSPNNPNDPCLGDKATGTSNYTPPFTGAPTPYLYLPLDEDFMYPISGGASGPYLLEYMAMWNESGETNGVYAVEASYDDFVKLVLAYASDAPGALKTIPYNGTPYWTGFYASRPELKILHYDATRLLLTAEVIGLLASGRFGTPGSGNPLEPSYWDLVRVGWENFAPSTHHDYICGTSPDNVTNDEQIPLLKTTCEQAASAVQESLNALLRGINRDPGSVVIANRLGQFFQGLIELPPPVPSGMHSINIAGEGDVPVQTTAEGGLVFRFGSASLGYAYGTLSPNSVLSPGAPSITPNTSGAASYTLQNEYLTVTVSAGDNWGISSIQDRSGSLLGNGAVGNDLVFYEDYGNLYQFGNEILCFPFQVTTVNVTTSGPGLGATILEQGPVRVRLQTVVSVSLSSGSHRFSNQTYTREYCLAAGEPFLRMTTTGAAPSYFSVMTAFPLAQPVTEIVHGTPCHWTSQQPYPLWNPPVFRPTHNFVLPYANGRMLAAVYHGDVPAWSFDGNGNLLGCLLRNTPNTGRGAYGSDSKQHTLHYVLRSPNALGNAATGQPLREAMNYTTPVLAGIVPANPMRVLPTIGFLASVSEPGVILAAKPGDVTPGTLILRLYQPTNSPLTLNVTLGRGRPASVVPVTALEDPITDSAPAIHITSNGFTIDTVTALNTVQIAFNS